MTEFGAGSLFQHPNGELATPPCRGVKTQRLQSLQTSVMPRRQNLTLPGLRTSFILRSHSPTVARSADCVMPRNQNSAIPRSAHCVIPRRQIPCDSRVCALRHAEETNPLRFQGLRDCAMPRRQIPEIPGSAHCVMPRRQIPAIPRYPDCVIPRSPKGDEEPTKATLPDVDRSGDISPVLRTTSLLWEPGKEISPLRSKSSCYKRQDSSAHSSFQSESARNDAARILPLPFFSPGKMRLVSD